MNNNCYALALTSLLFATGNVIAEENAKEKSPWKSSIELGFVHTSGNTETQNTSFKADVTYEIDKWRHNGHAEAYGAESEDAVGNSVVSAERYELSGKSDYKYNEFDYAFVLAKFEKDRFSGFEYEHVVSLGYGRKLIKQANMELDMEIGPGERFFKKDNGVAEEEALLRLSANYWWAITDNSKFTQLLESNIGEDVTASKSVTGIKANINSALALKFTYTVKYKNKVPAGIRHKDSEAAMTLVYSF